MAEGGESPCSDNRTQGACWKLPLRTSLTGAHVKAAHVVCKVLPVPPSFKVEVVPETPELFGGHEATGMGMRSQ